MLNEMMSKRIVLPKIVDYMRESQRKFYTELDNLEKYCNEKNIPIIPHETAIFLDFILSLIKPKNILEIGTAVGYSSILMEMNLDKDGQIITIERNPKMFFEAEKNIKEFALEDRIKIIFDDAKNVLDKMNKKFDFIFMDSAKAKYIEFYPFCMEKLNLDGILIVDDIFQGGTVFDDLSSIPRRNRKIHKRLNEFLDFIQNDSSVKSTLIPLGDGIIMIQKLSEYDYTELKNKYVKI